MSRWQRDGDRSELLVAAIGRRSATYTCRFNWLSCRAAASNVPSHSLPSLQVDTRV